MEHDVFISHSSKDKNIADAVCAILEQNNIPCWIAPRDVDLGRYAESIVKAIDETRIFVVILSKNSNKSKHVKNEVIRAFNQCKIIIPFRIEDIEPDRELSFFLGGEHWLNALTKPYKAHIQNLADKIKILLKLDDNKTEPQEINKKKNYEGLDVLKLTEICPECRAKNPEGFKFCVKCGYSENHEKFNLKGVTKKIKENKTIFGISTVIIIALIIGALWITSTGTDLNNTNVNAADIIKITDPINGSTVPSTYTVKGTFSQNAGSDKLYVLIQPQPLNGDGPFEWWANEPRVNSDGTWECSVQIGVPNGDIGRNFKICVITTDKMLQTGSVGYSLPKYNQKYEITVTRQ